MKRDEMEPFISSAAHGLTPAGIQFMLGYMTNADPDLAAEAYAALREHARGDEFDPNYWLNKPA